jgi:hypothetical protein
VLAHAGDQQPGDAIGQRTSHDDGDERDDSLRIERIIRQIRLRNGFEVELLALRLEAGRLERGEGRSKLLLGQ